MDIAKDEDIKIENPQFIENKNARFKSEQLLHLEQNLYNIKQKNMN